MVGDGADGTALVPLSQEAATAHMSKMDKDGYTMVGVGRPRLAQRRAASTPGTAVPRHTDAKADAVAVAATAAEAAGENDEAADDGAADGPAMSEEELAAQLAAGGGAAPVVALRHQGKMVLAYLEGRLRRRARAARGRVRQRSEYDRFAITMLRELEKAHGIASGEPYARAFAEGSGEGSDSGASLLRAMFDLREEITRLQAQADACERAGEGVDDALHDRLDALRDWQGRALPSDACHALRDVATLKELAWQLAAAAAPP